MVSTFVIVSAIIAIVAIALGAAYTTGKLDPVMEEAAKFFFKAKMEAEAKEMQARGMKEGQDFLKSELKGGQQLGDVKEKGLGGIGGGLGDSLGGGIGGLGKSLG